MQGNRGSFGDPNPWSIAVKNLFAILLAVGSISAWAQSDVTVNAAKEAGAVVTASGLV